MGSGRLRAALATALFIGLALAATDGTRATAAGDPVPYLAVSCRLPIWGFVGQPIYVGPAVVVDDVVRVLDATGGPGLAARLQFGLLAPFAVGRIPDTPSSAVTGGQIADAAVAQLPKIAALAPVAPSVAGAVRATVAQDCGFATHALNAGAPAAGSGPGGGSGAGGSATGGGDAGSGAGDLGGPDAPVGGLGGGLPAALYQFGGVSTVAARDYGAIPIALPGQFVAGPGARYGVPGWVPIERVTNAGPDDTPRTAGEAVSLGRTRAAGAIGTPLLLAVLALSAVTAALVRTWALRRLPA